MGYFHRIFLVVLLYGLAGSSAVRAVSPQPVSADSAMVVTSQRLASQVGVEILRQGGNAVDAAVAVGYALAAPGAFSRKLRKMSRPSARCRVANPPPPKLPQQGLVTASA